MVAELERWQRLRLKTVHAGRHDYGRGRDDVTVLIYFFWHQEVAASQWFAFECAIRETWLRCGMLKTVIVMDRSHGCVAEFAAQFPDVEVQVEPALVPGHIPTMSLDCVAKLSARFTTPYVLIVQNDGFPLREGLDEFVGKYDFIGPPATRDGRRGILRALGFPCLNGGFSLRSKRFCERVAHSWSSFWHHFISIDSRFFAEDTFATFTAMLSPAFRHGLRFPDEHEMFCFAYEALDGLVALPPEIAPFGFHGHSTAKKLLNARLFFEDQ